jgi:hypothetical protein
LRGIVYQRAEALAGRIESVFHIHVCNSFFSASRRIMRNTAPSMTPPPSSVSNLLTFVVPID